MCKLDNDVTEFACVCVKGPAMNIVAVCWHKSYHDDVRYAFFSLSHLQLSFYFQISTTHTYFLKNVHAISQLVQFEMLHNVISSKILEACINCFLKVENLFLINVDITMQCFRTPRGINVKSLHILTTTWYLIIIMLKISKQLNVFN